MARIIGKSARQAKPIYKPEPLPGEAAPAGSIHPFGVYERAQINTLKDKQDDLVADVLARRQREAKETAPRISNPKNIVQVETADPDVRAGKSFLENVVGTYASEEQRAAVERSRQEAATAQEGQAAKEREGRLSALNAQVTRLRELGVARYQPTTPSPAANLREAQSNFAPEKGARELAAERSAANKVAEDYALSEPEKQKRREETFAQAKAAMAKMYSTEGEDIGDGKYIDPITRQTKRRPNRGRPGAVSRDVKEAAKVVALEHYASTEEGQLKNKLAGTVKNPVTGELHPPLELPSSHKNPIKYMIEKMGVLDPERHIRNNYSHLLPKAKEDRDLGRAPAPKPFKSRSSEFMRTYLKNPLSALKEEQ